MGVDFRLGPSHRIKRRRDYLHVQSHGRKFRSKHFLVAVCSSKCLAGEGRNSRIGVTITRKIHKSAVRRNRLRRRIKEIYRFYKQQLAKAKIDFVIIALAGAADLEFADIKQELNGLFGKIARVMHVDGWPRTAGSQEN